MRRQTRKRILNVAAGVAILATAAVVLTPASAIPTSGAVATETQTPRITAGV